MNIISSLQHACYGFDVFSLFLFFFNIFSDNLCDKVLGLILSIHYSECWLQIFLITSCIPVSLYPCIPVSLYPCIPASLYPCIPVSMYPCIPVSLYPCILPVSLLLVTLFSPPIFPEQTHQGSESSQILEYYYYYHYHYHYYYKLMLVAVIILSCYHFQHYFYFDCISSVLWCICHYHRLLIDGLIWSIMMIMMILFSLVRQTIDYISPFSNCSICSFVKEVLFLCSFRFNLNLNMLILFKKKHF